MSIARERFYEVPTGVYLFANQPREASEQTQPEEPVRQWCAFELIRAYSIPVRDLQFEHPVKVGSKNYRIDILVRRNGNPWLVVECKHPEHTKHPEAMQQAISYASAQTISAEFALYTNGQEWHVQRCVRGRWVAVPDIPQGLPSAGGAPLVQLLRTLDAVAPLLHKLDEPMEGDAARTFLSAMQSFFNGMSLLTDGFDRDLLIAADNLLRVLSRSDKPSGYETGKLQTARDHLESFRKVRQLASEVPPVGSADGLAADMQYLYVTLMDWVEDAKAIDHGDILLLRLLTALLDYGQNRRDQRKPHPAIGPHLHRSLSELLARTLAVHLNVTLPDPLDWVSVGDMRNYCHAGWDALKE